MSLADTRLASAVKRANQRLRELEKQGLTNESVAYQRTRKDLIDKKSYASSTKSGEVKFRTDISKLSSSEKRQLKKHVETFLGAKTSTVKGTKSTIKKQYEKFKETTGFTGSMADFGMLWREQKWKAIVDTYGASEAINMVNYVQSVYGIGMELAVDEIYENLGASVNEIYNSIGDKYNSELEFVNSENEE